MDYCTGRFINDLIAYGRDNLPERWTPQILDTLADVMQRIPPQTVDRKPGTNVARIEKLIALIAARYAVEILGSDALKPLPARVKKRK